MKVKASILIAFSCIAAPCLADDPPKAPNPKVIRVQDEAAIRALIDGFVSAFEKGDARLIAGLFTEDGEAVDVDGSALQGRVAIEAHYTDRFRTSPGDKVKSEIDTIHFPAPGIARQDGRTRLIPADGSAPGIFRYTAMLVKGEGGWKVASLRELEDQPIGHHERLKELDWLVGDWIEETGEAQVSSKLGWTEDGNFLLRSFEVRVVGKPTLTGTQRIGWDPLTKQFKSWVFDSQGGYGDGYWTRNGDAWIVKSVGVRPDGLTTSATHVLTRLHKDRIVWKSTDRTLGGEARGDVEEFVMVRKPPEPK